MSNNAKKAVLVGIALIIFFGGVFILSILKPSQAPPGALTTPTPIQSPIPTSIINAPPPPKQQQYLPTLIPLLPYSTDQFKIEYLNTSQTFMITIKESPYEENRRKAQQWLTDKGINLGDLKIIYNKYRWVY